VRRPPPADRGAPYRIPKLLLLALLTSSLACSSPGEKELAFGDSLAYRGDYARALAAYELALERLPRTAYYHRIRAHKRSGELAYLFLAEYRRALHHFKALAELDAGEDGFAAREAIAEIARFKSNDLRQAIVEYQHLLELYPEHPQAPRIQLEVAHCYAQLGDHQQARVEARLMLERYPDSEQTHEVILLVADGLALEGNLQGAIDEYEKFLKDYKSSTLVPTAAFQLATCYEEAGRPEIAHRRLAEIATQLDDPRPVRQKMERLKARMRQRGR